MAKGDISTYNEDGVWKSKVEGSSRAAHTGGTKAEQQAVGREMAKVRVEDRFISGSSFPPNLLISAHRSKDLVARREMTRLKVVSTATEY
jgi:hypothetical protein